MRPAFLKASPTGHCIRKNADPWPLFQTQIKVSAPGAWESGIGKFFKFFEARSELCFVHCFEVRIVPRVFVNWMDGWMKESCVKVVWRWMRPEAGRLVAVVLKKLFNTRRSGHTIVSVKKGK